MEANFKIKMDNAAFQDQPSVELGRILRKVAEDVEWPIVTGGFKRNHEFGYVAFSNFNADGDSLSPPNDLIFWRPWRRLRRRMLKTVSSRVFQVQVWVSNDQPLTEQNEEMADDLLLAVRERFRAPFQTY